MKKEIDTLNATPSKRIFYSIIADYDLNRSICELMNNGLDAWVRGGNRRRALSPLGGEGWGEGASDFR
jgi:hypothetical protein